MAKFVKIIIAICALTDCRIAAYAAKLLYKLPDGSVHHKEISLAMHDCTGNQAVLYGAAAVLNALKYPCRVEIITPVNYLAHNQQFTSKWREHAIVDETGRRVWQKTAEVKETNDDGTEVIKTRKIGPIANQELWEKLLESYGEHQVTYMYARDSSSDLSTVADLARSAAFKLKNESRKSVTRTKQEGNGSADDVLPPW